MALIDSVEPPADIPTTETPTPGKPVQGALIEAAFVKFSGTSGGELDDPPKLDDERVYIVTGKCKKVESVLRADHEERFTVTMEIMSCYERGKVPIVDEAQPSLFADPNPEADENPGESGIDLSGVDRPGFSDAEGDD